MAETIFDDIIRIRRLVGEARRDHDNGKDISQQLGSIADELNHLLEKTEARFEEMENESFDARTRFVSELAGRFLEAAIRQRGDALMGSEVDRAVEMATETVRKVQARF